MHLKNQYVHYICSDYTGRIIASVQKHNKLILNRTSVLRRKKQPKDVYVLSQFYAQFRPSRKTKKESERFWPKNLFVTRTESTVIKV